MKSEMVRIDEKGKVVLIFDSSNPNWAEPRDLEAQMALEETIEEKFEYERDPDILDMDADFNELFLIAGGRFMNDILLEEEYLSLNEVLSHLGFKKQPFAIGYCYGWSTKDYEFVDFVIEKYDDYFEVTLNCSRKMIAKV